MSDEKSLSDGGAELNQMTNSGDEVNPSAGLQSSSDPMDTIAQLLMENEDGEETLEGSGSLSKEDGNDIQPVQTGDGSDPEGPDTGDTSEEQGGDSEPERLADLVDKLGTNYKTVYDNMKVSVGDGAEVTLGELKDGYKSQRELLGEAVASREALSAERQSMARERQVMELLLPHAENLPDGVKEQVKQQYEEGIHRETSKLHAALPELRDQNNFTAFREGVVEHMGQFGFQAGELNISDHRFLLFIKQAMDDAKFIKQLSEVKPVAKPQKRTTKQATKPNGRADGRNTNNAYQRDQQLDQIARLLGD